MKRLMQFALAAAVVVMACGAAMAQQQRQRGGFGGGFGAGTVMLLGQESVQKELKLSEDQVKQVKELSEKQRESFQGLRDLSQEERRTKMQEMAKAQNEAVAKLLKPEQLKRVKQISLQQQGANALSNPELAKALNITDEQKEKIQEIQTKAREEMRGLFGGGGGEEARKKLQDLRKATNEKAMAVLTAEQKTKLKEMQGEPFTGEIRFGGRNRRNQ